MKKSQYVFFIFLALSLVLLFACGQKGKFHDLDDYIVKLKQGILTTKNIKSIDSIPRPVPATYKKESIRTPFEATSELHGQAGTSGNPMNRYSLNILRFVGTLSQNNKIWAYIQTPDNKVYQVTIGDTIGDHSGRIAKISSNELEVVEPTSIDENQGAQRIITLQLKDQNE